jgi:nitrogen PTS system EIIA component
MIKLSDYLDESLVLFLDSKTRDECLHALVEQLRQVGKLQDSDAFFQAVLEREKLVSTGIGMGVAIPHAKQSHFPDFFLAIGVHRRGVDWDALDGSPVRLIFLIGGPDDKQSQYLQLLSTLTSSLRDPERRRKLTQASTAAEVLQLLTT